MSLDHARYDGTEGQNIRNGIFSERTIRPRRHGELRFFSKLAGDRRAGQPRSPRRIATVDEIIVPALSWSTTVWPLIQLGLVPVVVDIDPATLNSDPNEIEAAITEKTRGVMIVHVYGNPATSSDPGHLQSPLADFG